VQPSEEYLFAASLAEKKAATKRTIRIRQTRSEFWEERFWKNARALPQKDSAAL
jgi:hypothetical protein